MPHYTVFINQDPKEGFLLSYEHGVYPDIESASAAVHAAELSYPKSAVWVEDVEGNVVPREEVLTPSSESDSPPVCSAAAEDQAEEQSEEDEYYLRALEEEEARRNCPHNWKLEGDGRFHCAYGCGV